MRLAVEDDESAWRRRLLILRFEGQSPAQRIANFAEVLFRDEGEGILAWIVDGAITRVTFELFGAVFVFGVVASVAGVYQVRTGRRHPVLVALLLVAIAALVYFGYRVSVLTGPVN